MTGDAAKWWMLGGGLLQVAMGILGIMDTSIVGSAPDALLSMDTMHAEAHLLGGILAVGIGLWTNVLGRANATLAFGALFVFAFVSNLASPDFFGMLAVPANAGVHAMHGAIAVLSLVTGFVARRGAAPVGATATP